ncbi:hypothetical protein AB1Y20_020359 [Prymnesium parvum]|uniref:Uncharacterized protein n=1 Tax=Prymnesium parvum TaxID=97485 RepID=A0AB34JX63_PRYPA
MVRGALVMPIAEPVRSPQLSATHPVLATRATTPTITTAASSSAYRTVAPRPHEPMPRWDKRSSYSALHHAPADGGQPIARARSVCLIFSLLASLAGALALVTLGLKLLVGGPPLQLAQLHAEQRDSPTGVWPLSDIATTSRAVGVPSTPPLPPQSPPPLPPPPSPPAPAFPPRAPPPSLPRCSGDGQSVADCLNLRFDDGEPLNDVVKAGILLTQWDVVHNYDQPWLPAARDRSLGDHFVGTVKNANMLPGLWSDDLPGVVIAPAASRLFCAYSGDGMSQGDWKSCQRPNGIPPPAGCVPACNIDYQPIWCPPSLCNDTACTVPPRPNEFVQIISTSVRPGQMLSSDCAWPPDGLKWAMKQQVLRRKSVNEVSIDARPIIDQLPYSIEAFFVTSMNFLEKLERAIEAHQDFLEEYAITDDSVPLLLYTSRAGYEKDTSAPPFSVLPAAEIERARARVRNR